MEEHFRFSKIAETGTRVPRKTQAPLTFPGMLSTAGHCDQSRLAISHLLLFSDTPGVNALTRHNRLPKPRSLGRSCRDVDVRQRLARGGCIGWYASVRNREGSKVDSRFRT